jgi:hypothetical protein
MCVQWRAYVRAAPVACLCVVEGVSAHVVCLACLCAIEWYVCAVERYVCAVCMGVSVRCSGGWVCVLWGALACAC